jgi:hypothetical protein
MDTEIIRNLHRPSRIKILLLGESEPAGGDFFYLEKGLFYRSIKNSIWPIIKQSDVFLTDFMNRGIYLDDLVLEPIDHLSQAERKAKSVASIESLTRRLVEYKPEIVVSLMKGISQYVETAVTLADCQATVYTLPFPGNGHQNKFKFQIQEIFENFGG